MLSPPLSSTYEKVCVRLCLLRLELLFEETPLSRAGALAAEAGPLKPHLPGGDHLLESQNVRTEDAQAQLGRDPVLVSPTGYGKACVQSPSWAPIQCTRDDMDPFCGCPGQLE